MRPSSLVAGMTTLAVLAGGLILFQQHARLATLKHRMAELEARRAMALAHRPAVHLPPASDGLSDADRLELLRLRGEVTRLRARQQELAPLRVENQALRDQIRQKSPPPGYVRMRDAQFVGQATPDATLQSFIWAIAKGDTNALCQILTEEAAEAMMNDLQQRGQTEMIEAAHILPGYRLVTVNQRSPTEAGLEVELLPGEATEQMTVRLHDGRWRIRP